MDDQLQGPEVGPNIGKNNPPAPSGLEGERVVAGAGLEHVIVDPVCEGVDPSDSARPKSDLTQKHFDSAWLKSIANDDETRDRIEQILEWNEEVAQGQFRDSDEVFSLSLDGHTVWMRESEAWFAVHLYEHLFKDAEHLAYEGFSGEDAEVVLDLGANIGLYALAVKTNNPNCRVISVEPNSDAYELLQRNVEANGLENVHTLPKGVAGSSSPFTMRVLKEGSAYGGKYLGEIKTEHREWVDEERISETSTEGISLPDLFDMYGLEKVDILKMDVEGMELEILEGGVEVLGRVKRLVFEWHDHETKDRIISLLEANGFQLVHDDDREYGNLYFVNQNAI